MYRIALCSLLLLGGSPVTAREKTGDTAGLPALPLPSALLDGTPVSRAPLSPPCPARESAQQKAPAPLKSPAKGDGPPRPLLPPPLPVPPSLKLLPAPIPEDVKILEREMSQLRQAREALQKERAVVVAPSNTGRPPESETAAELRLRLAETLIRLRETRMKTQVQPRTTVSTTPVGPTEKVDLEIPRTTPGSARAADADAGTARGPVTEGPIDGAGLGRVLFLSGDYKGALAAYQALESAEQLPEDRLLTQYMIASCLRKLGKLEEATARYRDIANSGGRETLVKNAQWHLQAMKERQELAVELERIRVQRENLTRRAP